MCQFTVMLASIFIVPMLALAVPAQEKYVPIVNVRSTSVSLYGDTPSYKPFLVCK